MTGLNSNYILHMVEDVDRVIEILTEGYVPNYHKEDLSFSSEAEGKFVIGIPMTSFADVAVEDLAPLIKEYGPYVLVMSKQWALDSENLSPIHYISDCKYLKDTIALFKNGTLSPDFLRYSKNYISEWNGNPYCNYVEREWRHAVPSSLVDWIYGEDEYHKWRTDSKKRPKPTDSLKMQSLKFDVRDVLQIIVSTPKDKMLLNDALKNIPTFGGKTKELSSEDLVYIDSIVLPMSGLNIKFP